MDLRASLPGLYSTASQRPQLRRHAAGHSHRATHHSKSTEDFWSGSEEPTHMMFSYSELGFSFIPCLTSSCVSDRCNLFFLLPDRGHCEVFQLTLLDPSLVFSPALFLKIYILLSLFNPSFYTWKGHGSLIRKLGRDPWLWFILLHALMEILRKRGPLVPCKVIPLMTGAKWVPIVRACIWSIFLDDLKGVKGVLVSVRWFVWVGQVMYGRKSSLVGGTMSGIGLKFKFARPIFSTKISLHPNI